MTHITMSTVHQPATAITGQDPMLSDSAQVKTLVMTKVAPQQYQRRSYQIVQLQVSLLDDGFETFTTSDFDECGNIWYWHLDGRLARLSRYEHAVTIASPEWFTERNITPPLDVEEFAHPKGGDGPCHVCDRIIAEESPRH